MTFFTVTFHILIIAIAVGILFAVVVFVPLSIYVIPYCLWVGTQNTKGKYLELRKDNVFRMAGNATKLYKSWITHKAPSF